MNRKEFVRCAYASGMSYRDFCNATWQEARAAVDGYLKRNEDYLRGVRKVAWYSVMPYIEQHKRGTEFDLFEINGDPTKEELEELRNRELKSIAAELKKAHAEDNKEAVDYLKSKI